MIGQASYFADRREAGRLLAEAVEVLELRDPVVLALPRGGVPVGYEIATSLGAPLDMLLVRKIGAPGHEEYGIGAVVDGMSPHVVIDEEAAVAVGASRAYIQQEFTRQLAEIERRRALYRTGPTPPLKGRSVIMVDDGIATGGTVRVFGADPLENDEVLRRIVFVREDQSFPDIRVCQAVQAASWFYPNWDAEFAASLLDDFDLPPGRPVKRLSRGMRSALSITIGLAARSDLTLFDEPYTGLDAASRQLFYDRLLADYTEYPRAILLSTHLIDEVADALERVVVLDRGRVALDAPADEVRGTAATVSGPSAAVEEYVAGTDVTVAVLETSTGQRCLPPVAYFPRRLYRSTFGMYDYRAKNDPRFAKAQAALKHAVCPAQLPRATARELEQSTLEAVNALGVRAFGRADFRITEDGRAHLLEVNALPDVDPTSGFYIACRASGRDLSDLVGSLVVAYPALRKS